MKFELNAQARTLQGSGASRRLRRAGKVPGIMYGGEAASQAIELDHNDLLLDMKKEAFHASILVISVDGKKQQALLRDTQMHAYKPQILHVDFQRVSATEELHIMVPLHFINEDAAPGVKLSGGLVNHVLNEVDVQCLPKDLPEFIAVSYTHLRAHETVLDPVCRLLLEQNKTGQPPAPRCRWPPMRRVLNRCHAPTLRRPT